jgi:hypothetical protein
MNLGHLGKGIKAMVQCHLFTCEHWLWMGSQPGKLGPVEISVQFHPNMECELVCYKAKMNHCYMPYKHGLCTCEEIKKFARMKRN